MNTFIFDVGAVYERSVEAWKDLIAAGQEFSIGDALGIESTYAVLTNDLIGEIPIVGAIEGVAQGLLEHVPDALEKLSFDDLSLRKFPEYTVSSIELKFAEECISLAIKQISLGSSFDPMSEINSRVVDWLSSKNGDELINSRARLLAAVTVIGLSVRFPEEASSQSPTLNELIDAIGQIQKQMGQQIARSERIESKIDSQDRAQSLRDKKERKKLPWAILSTLLAVVSAIVTIELGIFDAFNKLVEFFWSLFR